MADTENNKNSNSPVSTSAPSLRFPGFTEPWRRIRLGKIATFSKGAGISKDQRNENGKPCILYGELYTTYTATNITNVISRTNLPEDSLIKSVANDVIIPSSGETAEDIATARCVLKNDVFLGGDLNIIRLNNDSGSFLCYQLNGVRKWEIAKLAQGVSVVHLYKESLKSLVVSIPSTDEQSKIAYFLQLLDDRIATQRRLIDKLETLIKGFREHLFKNMSGDVVCLSNIAEIYQPQTISSTELLDNGFPVYGANGVIGYYDSYNHETEQICITCRGNTCGTVNYSLAKSWITGNAMVVNVDNHSDIVCKRFLFHYLSEYNFKSIISGSGQPQIVRSPLQKLKVLLPTLDKQTQIAIFLDTILHKTDIENSELDLLQKQRQHLLQRMFI